MGRSGPQTHAKRQREHAKREKRREKDERRAARKAAKSPEKSPLTQGESATALSAERVVAAKLGPPSSAS